MVGIMIEPGYAGSVWGGNLYGSLVSQLRQKRIPFTELTDQCPEEMECVFLIGGNVAWTRGIIEQLNQAGHMPILICNQYEDIPGCLYSCVCSDVKGSMKALVELLQSRNRKQVALYGVGAASIGDLSRANSLFSWRPEGLLPMEVFYNDGSLEDCFREFYEKRELFDAVICANDYAAVSLVKGLEENDLQTLERLSVISCAGTRISELYRDSISSLYMNFEPYGKAALHIFESIRKAPYFSGMTIRIRWNLEQEMPAQKHPVQLVLPEQTDQFYDDPQIDGMIRVDKFLTLSEPVDREIFRGLMEGKTYQYLAEQCFLTESTVKYRIKRIVQLCGCESKQTLIRVLKEYGMGKI